MNSTEKAMTGLVDSDRPHPVGAFATSQVSKRKIRPVEGYMTVGFHFAFLKVDSSDSRTSKPRMLVQCMVGKSRFINCTLSLSSVDTNLLRGAYFRSSK